ncbi:hypothetical protein [Brucella anthropi]|uniref:hypothetical protein n=1 Tax=Brucella anthropi TaxID=529 RepID=UPI00320AB5CA
MSEQVLVSAIAGIKEPEKIRVVLYANNRFVHASLAELIKPLTDEINSLKTRVTALEA